MIKKYTIIFLMVETIIRIYNCNFQRKIINWNIFNELKSNQKNIYIQNDYFKSNMKLKYWNIGIFLFLEEMFRKKDKK